VNPSSRWWSFSRNSLSRPPYKKGAEANWIQRETLTTDGSGVYGTAEVVSSSGARDADSRVRAVASHRSSGNGAFSGSGPAMVRLQWRQWAGGSVSMVGASLVVLNGSGLGQIRSVVGEGVENGTLYLDSPLDGYITYAADRSDTDAAVANSNGAIDGNDSNGNSDGKRKRVDGTSTDRIAIAVHQM
jgi:hypothetical protein